jgi:hypothetical protein
MFDQDEVGSLELPIPAWLRQREMLQRWLMAAAMVVYFVVGFRLVPMVAAGRATTLWTTLDDRIPFLPWTIYVYAFVYTAMLYPLFVVRCSRLFQRVAMAYFAVLTISFVCYAVFPVTSIGLRPNTAGLSDHVFHEWGIKLNYALDEPYNLFPSLHLSIAILAMLSAWKAAPRVGALALPIVGGVGIAIFTTKQHFLADGVAAIGLAVAVFLWILQPYASREVPEAQRTFGYRGAAGYFAFHCGVYLALYVAFRMGARVW